MADSGHTIGATIGSQSLSNPVGPTRLVARQRRATSPPLPLTSSHTRPLIGLFVAAELCERVPIAATFSTSILPPRPTQTHATSSSSRLVAIATRDCRSLAPSDAGPNFRLWPPSSPLTLAVASHKPHSLSACFFLARFLSFGLAQPGPSVWGCSSYHTHSFLNFAHSRSWRAGAKNVCSCRRVATGRRRCRGNFGAAAHSKLFVGIELHPANGGNVETRQQLDAPSGRPPPPP